MKKKLMSVLPVILVGIFFASSPVSAVTFNQNQIIDDTTFDNVDIMNGSQIDSFLNSFPNSCISTASGFAAIDPTGYNPTSGFQYGGYVSAGQVIYDSAQAYGINPQVLLATLQKEQSLVEGGTNFCNDGDQNKYAAAMGYGCPDSVTTYSYTGLSLYMRNGSVVSSTGTTCVNSASKAGFSQQVIRAAWLLKFGEQRSEGRINWAIIKGNWNNSDDPQTCYGGPMTQGTYQRCPSGATTYYDGYTTIDGVAVHMDTGATAALYWYTPHFHGNQVFFNVFTSWFGDTIQDVYPWQVATATGGDGKYYLVVGNTKRWISDGQIYQDWGLDKYPLQQVSSAYLDTIPTIPDLGRLGLMKNGQYVFVDSDKKYTLDATSIANWGYNSSLALAAPINSVLSSLPTVGATNQFVQEDGTTNYYLMSSGALYPISTSYLSRWGALSPTVITTYSTATFVKTSTVDYRLTIGGKNYIVDDGHLLDLSNANATAAYAPLFSSSVTVNPSVLPFFTVQAASTLVQPNNGTDWEFLSGGQKHYVPKGEVAQAWGLSTSPQIISSDLLATFTTGNILSTVVHATDTGDYYILDGTKHLIQASQIPDWIGSGNSAMQMLNADIRAPSGSSLSTPIFRVAGTSNIYSAINGAYYYIQFGTILNGYGYPAKYPIATLGSIALSSMDFGGSLSQFLVSGSTTYYLQDGIAYPLAASAIGAWTSGKTPLTYPGSNFSQRFSLSSTSLTNLINDTTQTKWLVDGGRLINVTSFSDAYSFTTWSNIDVTNLPKSGNATYLVRSSTTPTDSRIWLINRGTKQWIVSLEEYDGYGGTKLPTTWLTDTTLDAIPTTTPSADPSIIIKSGGSGLKLLVDGRYYAFPDAPTLINAVGSNQVTDTSLSIYTQLGSQAGTLTRVIKDASNQKVYYLENGKKRWITNGGAYASYSSIPVATLPSEVVNWFPEGAPIN